MCTRGEPLPKYWNVFIRNHFKLAQNVNACGSKDKVISEIRVRVDLSGFPLGQV